MKKERHFNQVVLTFRLNSSEAVKRLLLFFQPTLQHLGLLFNSCFDVYFLNYYEEQEYFVSFLLFVVDEGLSNDKYPRLLEYLNQEKSNSLFQKKLEQLGCDSFSIDKLLPKDSKLIKRNYQNDDYSVFTIKTTKEFTWFNLFFILSNALNFNAIVFSEESNSLVNSSPVFGCCLKGNLVLFVAEKSKAVLSKQIRSYLKKHPELCESFKKQRVIKNC